jgi:hypothetical protein
MNPTVKADLYAYTLGSCCYASECMVILIIMFAAFGSWGG